MRSSRGFRRTVALISVISVSTVAVFLRASTPLTQTQPAGDGIDLTRLAGIDDLVDAAIEAGELQGVVILVWHRGQTVYQRAYGQRAIRPAREPMTVDTIFDLASLTKVVATTTAVMMLVEEGRLRLRDPVARYLPGFERHGKEGITLEHLLTHVSGLRADFDLDRVFDGYEIGVAQALEERPLASPGERFVYSDINFILLGEIVRRVSGLTLDRFSHQRIFGPLEMDDTTFNPPGSLAARIAPTQRCGPLAWPCGVDGATMLRGTVHDPTARRMGGVSGHAGLFGTAADLARFSAMVLSGGVHRDTRILAPLTVARMTTPASPAGMADRRGLGWDIDSRYSANRGDLFPVGSFGHTGFTGTSIWLDPGSHTAVVFLSSRLYPDGQGNVTALRGRVATLAAAAVRGVEPGVIGRSDQIDHGAVRTGIDVLRDQRFARLDGERVALLTNQTGRAQDGESTTELLLAASNVDLRALLSPEHGPRGDVDEVVSDTRDPSSGLPVYSLYGKTRRPTTEMLNGIDTVVVDLQDAGARFYTYATTMAYVMEAAATQGIRVVVLDRPNPINGQGVEGPTLDAAEVGFTGYLPMPVRHGLTLGELARTFNRERQIGAELEVVELDGWHRDFWFDETGLTWVDPSPNLRSVTQAVLYPGIGAIEGTNISVGRGTDTPFERVGAPWVDGVQLAARLNTRNLAGVRFYPVVFTPATSRHAGQVCGGVKVIVTSRDVLRPVRVGLEIAAALHQLYGDQFELDRAVHLFGSRDTIARVKAGEDPAEIAASWRDAEREWRARREPYLLY